jgi:hypothetical protein
MNVFEKSETHEENQRREQIKNAVGVRYKFGFEEGRKPTEDFTFEKLKDWLENGSTVGENDHGELDGDYLYTLSIGDLDISMRIYQYSDNNDKHYDNSLVFDVWKTDINGNKTKQYEFENWSFDENDEVAGYLGINMEDIGNETELEIAMFSALDKVVNEQPELGKLFEADEKIGYGAASDLSDNADTHKFPPVYVQTLEYAAERQEAKQYHESDMFNNRCGNSIDKAINATQKNLGMAGANTYDLRAALSNVIAEYGAERVIAVIAYTINKSNYDMRLSDKNKSWAKSIDVPKVEYIPLDTHLSAFNGFADYARQAYEKARDMTDGTDIYAYINRDIIKPDVPHKQKNREEKEER